MCLSPTERKKKKKDSHNLCYHHVIHFILPLAQQSWLSILQSNFSQYSARHWFTRTYKEGEGNVIYYIKNSRYIFLGIILFTFLSNKSRYVFCFNVFFSLWDKMEGKLFYSIQHSFTCCFQVMKKNTFYTFGIYFTCSFVRYILSLIIN